MAYLSPNKDPMGAAIRDFHQQGKASRLRVFSPNFDEDVIPVDTFFRSFSQMPALEQKALQMAKGRILDVGAGAGCHSLVLQEMGKQVEAIDISSLSVETMRLRGVEKVSQQDFFEIKSEQFDTILLLMNGSGIVGRLDSLPRFFQHIESILSPFGQILMDSSDLSYIFLDDDGHLDWNPADGYYGEVEFQLKYRNITSNLFHWLYVDYETLSLATSAAGFQIEKVMDGPHYDYLARIWR